MRPDHWTAVNEIEHWGWRAYEHALNGWLAALPDDHEAHDLGPHDQGLAFFDAHPDGWDLHPDTPHGIDGTHVTDLRVENV